MILWGLDQRVLMDSLTFRRFGISVDGLISIFRFSLYSFRCETVAKIMQAACAFILTAFKCPLPGFCDYLISDYKSNIYEYLIVSLPNSILFTGM